MTATPGTPTSHHAPRTAPRSRRAPSAVLADEQDFARHARATAPSPSTTTARYLRQMEALLRTLASQGVPHHRQPSSTRRTTRNTAPDTASTPTRPDSRTRYTAEVATHRRHRRRTRASRSTELAPATSSTKPTARRPGSTPPTLLARVGACADCGEDIGRRRLRPRHPGPPAAPRRARRRHATTSSAASRPETRPSWRSSTPPAATAPGPSSTSPRPSLLHRPRRRLRHCAPPAASSPAPPPPRPTGHHRRPRPRHGPRLDPAATAWPRPLTAAEVFAAYCTDADTGEPDPTRARRRLLPPACPSHPRRTHHH